MKYTELKNSISEGAQSIYLLEGDDAYFRMKGEEQIKDAFLQMPELNFTAFDGESMKGNALSELVAALKNYPFMAEKRIVKVTEFYPSESDYENKLKSVFEDFPPSAILIIVNPGGKKGVDLKRKRAVTFVDCNKSDAETVAKWVYITVRRAGVNISAAACEKIAEYCVSDMARVSVEVKKLLDYKTTGEITLEEVEELVYKDADYKLYELTNAAGRRDFTKYCVIADELKTKAGDEAYILNGLFNYFKNLLTSLTFNGSVAELAALLKVKEFAAKKNAEAARGIGERKLRYLTERLYNCISDIKCGKITPQNSLAVAENCIFFGQG